MPEIPALRPTHLLHYVRQGAWVVVIGILVGLLLWILDGGGILMPQLVSSVWMAMWIFALCQLGTWLFRRPLERLSPVVRRVALGVIFFVAGAAAWGAGMATLRYGTFGWLTWSPEGDLGVWARRTVFTGILGLLIGLTFASFEVLQERLRQSVARLKEQEFALRELATAREIQQRLLPPGEIRFPGHRVTARSEPAQMVAGDFYDAFSLPDGSFAVAVGDVAGKGMGASLLMASVKAMLPLVAMGRSAAETLQELNRRLAPDLGRRQFVALTLARVEPGSGRFTLANAGMPDPYVLRWAAGGPGVRGAEAVSAVEAAPGVEVPVVEAAVEEVSVPGPRLPLGVRQEVGYEEREGRLRPGEALLMISDGLPEAADGDGELLGYDGTRRLLLSSLEAEAGGDAPAGRGLEADADWLGTLFARLARRVGADRGDDWTALLLEVEAGAAGAPPPDAASSAVAAGSVPPAAAGPGTSA